MIIHGKVTEGKLEGDQITIQLGDTASKSRIYIDDEPLLNVKRVEIIYDTSKNKTEIIIHKIFPL